MSRWYGVALLLPLLACGGSPAAPSAPYYVAPYAPTYLSWVEGVDVLFLNALHRHVTADDIQILWPNLIGPPPSLATVRAELRRFH